MPRIQQLSPHVVAQIAAGEVIERPASVLKELLENSVDAGSTRIDVAIGQGGLEYLRVVDDGCGIDALDLPLAFAAHATSKLRSADELCHVATLGFRGEGLASIGSVAQVGLQSRTAGSDQGAEVRCDGGAVGEVRVWNGAPGTRIEVRHLFYNVPGRRKFLKGPATEMGHVIEVFTRLALSQLSLHLSLEHNGKRLHDVPATAGLLDRVATFFGDDLRQQLLMLEGEQEGMTIGGYVADPIRESQGTQMQYLFVNGRWVRDRVISQALQEAYRGLLLTGKHPTAFLFVEVPAEDVDVNVHPTKAEVRFRQPQKVQELVQTAVRKRLEKADLTATLRVKEVEAKPVARPAPSPESTKRPARNPLPPPPVKKVEKEHQENRGENRPAPPAPPPPAKPLKAVQMHDLYLVVEAPEGILVIDQHALHERILFEQLKARIAAGKLDVQKLLIPEPVTFPGPQAALLLDHRAALGELGLEIDDFGGGTVLIGGYPALLGKRSPRDILRGVVEYLTRQDRPPSQEVLLNDLLALMACHSAVRAGDRLSSEEIRVLLEGRDLAHNSHHCPHGRPASLMFTKHELDRQFRRLG